MRFTAFITTMALGQSLAARRGRGVPSRNGHPTPPGPRRSARFYGRFALICLTAAGFFYVFSNINKTDPPSLPAESPSAALPAWIEIPDPAAAFLIEAPEFGSGPKFYSARRHRTGGGRQDIFEFGGSGVNAPLLNLALYQPGNEAAPESSFYVELARRAAETGRAVVRAEQPAQMAAKFGTFDIALLDLTRDGTARRQCLGFRFSNAQPRLRITGFACGGEGALSSLPALKSALACVIDRIELVPEAGNKGLADFFAAHYAKPDPACPGFRLEPAPFTKTDTKTEQSSAPRNQRKRHYRAFN